ncbi:PACE efflux transporter [Halotalea alkalilenta]|uniref:PACE efflux transporter n=1 Tax=Halotalea alkalilenta TaxID=376489 RepID=UPI000489F401|nr:PACE efflux transporter [Halotalea alkalilenta]
MRTTLDRLRHTLLFEAIGILIVLPLGSYAFSLSPGHMGVVGIVSAVIAAVWNYLYNLGFDHALRRWRGSLHKGVTMRIFHALLFEAGLLSILQPLAMLYLGTDALAAFSLVASLAVFYVCYAFIYNWAYDRLFPLPATAAAVPSAMAQRP